MTTEKQEFKWVGTRPVRPDGMDKVTGRAKFGADLHLPGMLVGKVLRSPHAHARIISIDSSAAEKLPGVKAVVSGDDFPPVPPVVWEASGETPVNFRDLARNVMARDKALYDGHAVAAVAATSAVIAEKALALIKVEYEVLPHVIDVAEAMKPDAPVLHDDMFTDGVSPTPDKPSNIAKKMEFVLGDIEKGFEEADIIVERGGLRAVTFQVSDLHGDIVTGDYGDVIDVTKTSSFDMEIKDGGSTDITTAPPGTNTYTYTITNNGNYEDIGPAQDQIFFYLVYVTQLFFF